MTPRPFPRAAGAVLLLFTLALGRAAEPAAKPAQATDDDLRMPGVFDSALPRTERKSSLRLVVHPHLGDFWEHDHLRTALGLRYGLTARWEATTEVDAYFSHGLRGPSFFEDKGFSGVHLGTKYQLGDPLRLGWETSVGIDWSKPVGTPPPEITDGLEHTTPFVTFSRQLAEHPAWRVFFGFNYEDVNRTSTPGILGKNQLDQSNTGINGGFLYERGPLTYTLEAAYDTERLGSGGKQDLVMVRPGFVWVVPPKYTFGGKGKWLLGFSLKFSHGHDGLDVGAGAKLRVNFDFKRLLGLRKDPAPVK